MLSETLTGHTLPSCPQIWVTLNPPPKWHGALLLPVEPSYRASIRGKEQNSACPQQQSIDICGKIGGSIRAVIPQPWHDKHPLTAPSLVPRSGAEKPVAETKKSKARSRGVDRYRPGRPRRLHARQRPGRISTRAAAGASRPRPPLVRAPPPPFISSSSILHTVLGRVREALRATNRRRGAPTEKSMILLIRGSPTRFVWREGGNNRGANPGSLVLTALVFFLFTGSW
jgi:hypothetical protein